MKPYPMIVRTINDDYAIVQTTCQPKINTIQSVSDVVFTDFWTGSNWSENQETAKIFDSVPDAVDALLAL